MWTNNCCFASAEILHQKEKPRKFAPLFEKWREAPKPVVVARVSTAIYKTSTQANERRCRYSGNGRNNIQEFSFWQEKN
jgi:hypothetical protein